jgi:molybdopterin-containing oxidoreductase family membrane subunit
MTGESATLGSSHREPILSPEYDLENVSRKISDIPFARKPPLAWWIGFALSFLLLMTMLMSASYLLLRGVGVWGINVPVAWGFAIVNFVWWIGIGHAGTLISAILFLLHQEWRNSSRRFSEATTN